MLLLQEEFDWSAFSRSFAAHEPRSIAILAAISALALMAFAATVYLYLRHQPKQSRRLPRRLFRDLCRGHSLGRAHRRALGQMSELVHADQPGVLFVRLDTFDQAARLWKERHPGADRAELANEIRNRLFG